MMNHRIDLSIGSLALLAAICCVAPGNAAEVVLRELALPAGTVVLLGDVAEIHGADRAEARQLARMPLWPSPAPGQQRRVTATALRDTLRLRGIDLSAHRFAGADGVTISSPQDATTPQTARPTEPQASPASTPNTTPPRIEPSDRYAMAGSTVPRQGTGYRPQRRPSAQGTNVPKVLTAAERLTIANRARLDVIRYLEEQIGESGNLDVELRLSPIHAERISKQTGDSVVSGGRAPWTGRQSLTLEFATADGPDQLTLIADVLDTTPILIVKRPIARGQMLTAADVALEAPSRDTHIPNGQVPLGSLEDVLQKEASRALRPGEALTSEMCLMPLMIQRNQPVTVEISGGGIRLTRQAIGLTDARLGDYSEVQLLETKERLSGRVVGSGRIALVDAGSVASRSVPRETTAREKRYQPY